LPSPGRPGRPGGTPLARPAAASRWLPNPEEWALAALKAERAKATAASERKVGTFFWGGNPFIVTKDENGNERLLTDAKGQTVTSTYDELNRLKTKAYAFAMGDSYRPWRHTTGTVYTYDPNGNLTQVDESVASGTDPPATLTTTRGYDDLDRLLSETTPLPDGGTRTVAYTYFANGTRRTVTDPSAVATSYAYDGQNRLETATTRAGVTTYAYWPDDLLRTVTYANGVVATHGYDKADRLTSLANARGATTVSSYAYTYDDRGNRLTQVETNGGTTETTTYTYDDLSRLETVTYPVDHLPAGTPGHPRP